MSVFSQALAAMNLDDFVPHPAAEANQSDLEIAEDAALSRLRLIQDGGNQLEICRSSSTTGPGGPATA
jgi:hypothetical protein